MIYHLDRSFPLFSCLKALDHGKWLPSVFFLLLFWNIFITKKSGSYAILWISSWIDPHQQLKKEKSKGMAGPPIEMISRTPSRFLGSMDDSPLKNQQWSVTPKWVFWSPCFFCKVFIIVIFISLLWM